MGWAAAWPTLGSVDRAALNNHMHLAFIEATRLIASVVPNGACAEVGEWFVYDAGVDNVDFNTAAISGDADRGASQIGEVERWYEQRRAAACVKLRPGPDDAVIGALPAAYRETRKREPYLVRALGESLQLPDCGLQIIRVESGEDVTAYDSFDAERGRPPDWSIAADVTELSGCSLWIGRLDGKVAARAMCVATDPVATIHNVVVAEEFRGRGFGKAITRAAVAACAAAGADYACLGSSTMGLPMYLAMGFEHRYDLATFTNGVSE
jgi:GNAT superfamily N-acetyltransferase